MLKELQSLSLDVKILTSDNVEIDIKEELEELPDVQVNSEVVVNPGQTVIGDIAESKVAVAVDTVVDPLEAQDSEQEEKLEESYIIQDEDELLE